MSVSNKAKQTQGESITVYKETKLALCEPISASYGARKALYEPNTAFTKASWITKKSNLASYEDRDNSLLLASSEATLVSICGTIPALHRAKPCFSCETKAKAPLGASTAQALSEANSVSLTARLIQFR